MQPTFSVRPLRSARPGAEVSGLQAKDFTAADVEKLKHTLADHGVIVLRNQEMTPKQYITFARLFGEIEPSTREQFWHPDEPEIYVISNVVENGRLIGNPNDGFGWHTDQYYFERPSAYTFLYGIETPPEGADTKFCDTFELYDELSEARREEYGKIHIRASHSKLNAGRLHPGQEEKFPDRLQSLIRKHPVSGKRFLYFSGLPTSNAHGMSEEEFLAFHKGLHERATQADRVYAHKWLPNDLVIWDNRGLLHTATPYDKEKHRRICHRITVLGEKPFN